MKTIALKAEAEILEKKSRFISYAFKVSTEAEARERIEEISDMYHDATHVVYAYVHNENGVNRAKYSDAGEPKCTAGRPILEFLKKTEMMNVIIVVARYFGGIKLGTGGLSKTYLAAAKAVLEKAGIIDYVEKYTSEIECEYPLLNHLLRKISEYKNCDLLDRRFSDKVILKLSLTKECLEDLNIFLKQHVKHGCNDDL